MTKSHSTNLVEREAEVAILKDALATAQQGAGSLLLIEGPAGIGKSALLAAAFLESAPSNIRFLNARATEFERNHPFGVVRQLFESLIRGLDEAQRRRLLSGAAQHAAPIFGLGSRAPHVSHFAVLDGLYWVVEDLSARETLALLIDDAHWADEPSLEFLAFLEPRVSDLHVAMLVSGRDEPEASLINQQIRCDPVTRLLRPSPLSHQGSCVLLGRELGARPEVDFVRACHSVTGGNPFYLRELAAELASRGVKPVNNAAGMVSALAPATIADAVRIRLAKLGGTELEVARAVAVLGDHAEVRQVADLTGLHGQNVALAADQLVRLNVFSATEDTLAFAHPIVRNALYEDIGSRRRAFLHGQVARLFSSEFPPERVSSHLLLSEPAADGEVVATLRLAARQALGQGAPQTAVRFLARALREPPGDQHGEVLYELGLAESRARLPAAIEHLQAALRLCTEPRHRAEISIALANELGLAGEADRPVALLEEAAGSLGPGDRELLLQVESMIAGVCRQAPGTLERFRARLPALEGELRGDDPGERLLLANIAFHKALDGCSVNAVCELARRALAGDRLLAEIGSDAVAFYFAVTVLTYRDRYDEAERHLQEALAQARTSGSFLGFALACTFRSLNLLASGQLPDAEVDARAAIDAFRAGDLAFQAIAKATLTNILIEQGNLLAAESLLNTIPNVRHPDGGIILVWPRLAGAHVLVGQGHQARALEEVLGVGRTATEFGICSPSFLPWRSSAALIYLALGQRRKAHALALEELELARVEEAPRAAGIAMRSLALVVGGEQAVAMLQESNAALGKCGAQLEQARSLTALGSALRRRNRRAEAREPLKEAMELAHRCGASVVENQARTELAATGARPRRAVRTGLEALTPSELRIARMAANHMSNRSIAQALFVTPKTVETHLSHIYDKLEVRSRDHLQKFLIV